MSHPDIPDYLQKLLLDMKKKEDTQTMYLVEIKNKPNKGEVATGTI